MSTATTLKHRMHHDGHLPHGRGLWVVLALVALIAGLLALVAQSPTLMQYYEMPRFPIY